MEFQVTENTNSVEFSEFIEKTTIDGNYIDTIIDYCRENYIDLEDIKSLIHPTLKEKIRAEAMKVGLMKSLGTLEF